MAHEEKFEVVWLRIQNNLHPGSVVRNWTAYKGYLGDDMQVMRVESECVIIKSPKAKRLQCIHREEFLETWGYWHKYRQSEVRRQVIRDISYHSKYIISIFKCLEENI